MTLGPLGRASRISGGSDDQRHGDTVRYPLEAAANLEFETAARLRDEVKKLREVEIGVGVEGVMGPAD